MMSHDDQMIARSVGTSPSEGIFSSVWLFVLAGNLPLGIWAVMMHCLPPGIDNMSQMGIASSPFWMLPLSPYHHQWDIVGSSGHGKWKMTRGNKKCIICGLCLKRLSYRGDGDILMEQDGLNWQLRWELKVLFLNALGWLLGWSMAWCDIGRKGGAAGWTVYSRVGGTTVFTQHPTSQHVKICKYTHTNLH